MENIIQEKEKSSRVNWMNNKYFLFGSRRLQPAGVDYKRNLKVAATFKFRIFGQHNTNAEKRSRSRQSRDGIKPNRIIKNKEKGIQKIRFIVQTLFALLCIWIGVEFYQFIQFLETSGAAAFTSRPPGVDGFLPISSFMGFYLFLVTGEVHAAHPAGFFIFFAIVLVSIVFGKAFCSWLCPVGFLSELIGDFGKKIFGKDIEASKIS